ncbi:DUF930 domain-containing protein [Bartonella sp. DGB1]|uniref:DUF930 domain-containing protein n=1 Tax=Bartonella sp. DGB1 TaxID=3239807 RepID=UPI0035265F61
MRHFLYICIFAVIFSSNSLALSSREISQLKSLDPQTRIEQACNIAAMEKIKQSLNVSPEKMIAYAFGDTFLSNHNFKAPHAAIRINHKWYYLSYDCTAKSDHIHIEQIKVELGTLVPRNLWDPHYLVPAAGV